MIATASLPAFESLHSVIRSIASSPKRFRPLPDSWETWIGWTARKFAYRRSDVEDLAQIGRAALFRAATQYESTSGTPFENYGKRSIRNDISKESQRLHRQRRLGAGGGEFDLRSIGDHRTADPVLEDLKAWLPSVPPVLRSICETLYEQRLTQREAVRLLAC